jgi:hypothetical protein
MNWVILYRISLNHHSLKHMKMSLRCAIGWNLLESWEQLLTTTLLQMVRPSGNRTNYFKIW